VLIRISPHASPSKREPGNIAAGSITAWPAALALLLALSVFSCSHYSTSGRLPEHIRTVHIPTFENETAEFYLPQLITDEVTDRFLSDANLRLGEAGGSDAALTGAVIRYFEEAETFGGNSAVPAIGSSVCGSHVVSPSHKFRATRKS